MSFRVAIPLANNKGVTYVSPQDAARISFAKLHIKERSHTNTSYAACGNSKKLHRLILDAPAGVQVDHIDGDGLNNCRENLRLCTASQNGMNRQSSKGSTSKHKGVSWNVKHNKWLASIRVDGKNKHLGHYDHEEDAARAYNDAAIKYFGEFAKLNDVEGLIEYKPRGKTKGYYWNKQAKKWQACITVDGKQKYLGIYATEKEARNAYLLAKAQFDSKI